MLGWDEASSSCWRLSPRGITLPRSSCEICPAGYLLGSEWQIHSSNEYMKAGGWNGPLSNSSSLHKKVDYPRLLSTQTVICGLVFKNSGSCSNIGNRTNNNTVRACFNMFCFQVSDIDYNDRARSWIQFRPYGSGLW